MAKTLYQNVRLVDPSQNLDGIEGKGHLLIEKDKILSSGTAPFEGEIDPSTKIKDLYGKAIIPGLVDGRVFIGEPGSEHRETIKSVGDAAAAGGVCSLIMMPETAPTIDDVSLVEFIYQSAREHCKVNIYPSAAITKGLRGDEMCEIGLLKRAGAVVFCEGTKTLNNNRMIRRAMAYARDFNAVLMLNTQDPDLSKGGVMNEGLNASRLGLTGIPAVAEHIALMRDLHLAQLTNAHYMAAMISTKESAQAIKAAKQKNDDGLLSAENSTQNQAQNQAKISAGVSINHLTLNENDIGRYRTFFRLSPPLRLEEDRQAMIEALSDGTIDIIVSDHNPQDVDTKRHPFADAANGAIGLETFLAAALRLYHSGQVPLLRLIEAMSTKPAELFSIDGGTLKVGAKADFAVLDLDYPWVLEETDIHSLSKNTPFEGARFLGKVMETTVDGRIVYSFS